MRGGDCSCNSNLPFKNALPVTGRAHKSGITPVPDDPFAARFAVEDEEVVLRHAISGDLVVPQRHAVQVGKEADALPLAGFVLHQAVGAALSAST